MQGLLKNVQFKRKPTRDELDPRLGVPFKVEETIILHPIQFERFLQEALSEGWIFIEENKDKMYIDKDGVYHCTLVKSNDHKFGILVYSEGYSYARYAASIPLSYLESVDDHSKLKQKIEEYIEELKTSHSEYQYLIHKTKKPHEKARITGRAESLQITINKLEYLLK